VRVSVFLVAGKHESLSDQEELHKSAGVLQTTCKCVCVSVLLDDMWPLFSTPIAY